MAGGRIELNNASDMPRKTSLTGTEVVPASDASGNPVAIPTALLVQDGGVSAGHIADQTNPHGVTKVQVGLGEVDDTSDADKPVSTAQQTAISSAANELKVRLSPIYVSVSGSSNALSLTTPTGSGTLALVNGFSLLFIPSGSNTDVVTLSLDGGSALPLVLDADGTEVQAGTLGTAPVIAVYDAGNTRWRLLAGGSGSSTGKSLIGLITGNSVEIEGVFDSFADGVLLTKAGNYFAVPQKKGTGCYVYENTDGSTGIFIETAWFGSRREYEMEANLSSDMVSDVDHLLFGSVDASLRWDGRVLLNMVGAVEPTLNLVSDPWGKFQEKSGGFAAVATYPVLGELDELGNERAMRLVYDHQNDVLAFFDGGIIPSDDYRITASIKLESGNNDFRLGSFAAHGDVTVSGSWADYEAEVTTDGEVGIFGGDQVSGQSSSILVSRVGLYDNLAGDTLPTAAEELASQNAAHGKMAGSFRGSIEASPRGGIDMTDRAGILIPVSADYLDESEYTMGIAVDVDTFTESTNDSAISFADEGTSTYADNAQGQIAVSGRGDSFGRPYATRSSNDSIAKCLSYLPGAGWTTLYYSQGDGEAELFVNGVSMFVATESPIAKSFRRLIVGAYNGVLDGDITTANLSGRVDFPQFWTRRLTRAEIAREDHKCLNALRRANRPVNRSVFEIFNGDSLTQGGWPNDLAGMILYPPINGVNRAVGGKDLDEWLGIYLEDTIQQACTAARTHDRVVLYQHLGNEGDGTGPEWASGAITDTTVFSFETDISSEEQTFADTLGLDGVVTWKSLLQRYFRILKTACPKLEIYVMGMQPMPSVHGVTPWSDASISFETERQRLFDEMELNRDAWSIDGVINLGRGTERVTAASAAAITAETKTGGTVMGDYRQAAAGITYSRTITTGVTLSATDGSSFTATATAGTFTYQDVRRVLEASTGSAQITEVNADGSVATLSTDGYVPPETNPDEPASNISDATVTRTAFDSTGFSSGDMTVRHDADNYFQSDGLHLYAPGNRIKANRALSKIQELRDGVFVQN